MAKSRNMSIQFVGGTPDGIRVCRCTGRQLVTIVVPRDLLPDAKRLEKIPQRGIYYLLKMERGGVAQAYAGQTTQGLRRLDDHKSKKDWWDLAVMHLAPHEAFTLDIVNGLESYAIKKLQESGCGVANDKPNNIHINEFDITTIEELYEDIVFRMEALAFALRPPESKKASLPVFHTKKRGIAGLGTYDPEAQTFTLLPGCEIDLGTAPIRSSARQALEGLVGEDGKLISAVEFSSPSTAATAVLGGSQNGWTEWVDESGATLDSVFRNKEN